MYGYWFLVVDMVVLWDELIDLLLCEICEMCEVVEENWFDEVFVLFCLECLLLFVGNDVLNDKIYLFWFDCEEELEIWVYDLNGEGCYLNFVVYFFVYFDDDFIVFE